MRGIVDAGPLIALIDRRDRDHAWAHEQIKHCLPPLLVCEPVLTETLHRVGKLEHAASSLFHAIDRGGLRIAFRIDEQTAALRRMMEKYADRPISLADACVVRMAELFEDHVVLTLDSDFLVYRKHGRHPLPIVRPERPT